MTVRRERGGLETAVISVISAAAAPIAVAQVQRALPGSPAYTTVMTTMSRLAAKGALRQIRDGRAYLYALAAPAGAVDTAVTARRMSELLHEDADRPGVLARFVAELDPDEERLLARFLGSGEGPGS